MSISLDPEKAGLDKCKLIEALVDAVVELGIVGTAGAAGWQRAPKVMKKIGAVFDATRREGQSTPEQDAWALWYETVVTFFGRALQQTHFRPKKNLPSEKQLREWLSPVFELMNYRATKDNLRLDESDLTNIGASPLFCRIFNDKDAAPDECKTLVEVLRSIGEGSEFEKGEIRDFKTEITALFEVSFCDALLAGAERYERLIDCIAATDKAGEPLRMRAAWRWSARGLGKLSDEMRERHEGVFRHWLDSDRPVFLVTGYSGQGALARGLCSSYGQRGRYIVVRAPLENCLETAPIFDDIRLAMQCVETQKDVANLCNNFRDRFSPGNTEIIIIATDLHRYRGKGGPSSFVARLKREIEDGIPDFGGGSPRFVLCGGPQTIAQSKLQLGEMAAEQIHTGPHVLEGSTVPFRSMLEGCVGSALAQDADLAACFNGSNALAEAFVRALALGAVSCSDNVASVPRLMRQYAGLPEDFDLTETVRKGGDKLPIRSLPSPGIEPRTIAGRLAADAALALLERHPGHCDDFEGLEFWLSCCGKCEIGLFADAVADLDREPLVQLHERCTALLETVVARNEAEASADFRMAVEGERFLLAARREISSQIAACGDEPSRSVQWPSNESLSRIIHRSQTFRTSSRMPRICQCLTWLDLKDQDFSELSLTEADFSYSILDNCSFDHSVLTNAILTGTSTEGVVFAASHLGQGCKNPRRHASVTMAEDTVQ